MRLRRSHAIKYRNVPEIESSDTEFSIQSDFLQQTIPANDFYDRDRQVYFTGSHCTSSINNDAQKKSVGHQLGVRLERFTTPPSFPPSIRSRNSSVESIASSAEWTEVNNTPRNPQMIPERERIGITSRRVRPYWAAYEVEREPERIAVLDDLSISDLGDRLRGRFPRPQANIIFPDGYRSPGSDGLQ